MKRVALMMLLVCGACAAEDMPNNVPQTTSPIVSARYEIVASSWMRKLTFRLDRYNGRVWMKVVDPKENKLWESMYVEDNRWSTASTHAHFQIFLSGFFASDTFLIDTDSGKVWMVVAATKKPDDTDTSEHLFWQSIDEENKADAPTAPVKP